MNKNRWEEVRRTFTPPMERRFTSEGIEDIMMKLSFGFTTIEYHDKKNRRAPKFVVLYGDQRLS